MWVWLDNKNKPDDNEIPHSLQSPWHIPTNLNDEKDDVVEDASLVQDDERVQGKDTTRKWKVTTENEKLLNQEIYYSREKEKNKIIVFPANETRHYGLQKLHETLKKATVSQ